MQYLLLPLLLTILNSLTTAQQLIPQDLPSCAQQCTVLEQGQTGCTPAGGAPVTSQGTYQSCFCQSALLTQLYAESPVQLCSTCSSTDMSSIQNWYKTFCGRGAAPAANNGQQPPTSATSSTSTTGPTNRPASGATSADQQGAQDSDDNGSWFQNHWRWIVMLIVIVIGLIAIAVGGWFLHRRYHRRRESQWSSAPGSQPNINTWGPGQSVHDLGLGAGVSDNEKGKVRHQVSGMPQPPEAHTVRRERIRRSRGKFF